MKKSDRRREDLMRWADHIIPGGWPDQIHYRLVEAVLKLSPRRDTEDRVKEVLEDIAVAVYDTYHKETKE